MSKTESISRKRAPRALLTTALLLALSACVNGNYPQTTWEPVSEYGRLLNHLFMNTFWYTMVIMVIVEILLLAIVFKFRDRPGATEPKHIHGHTGLEIAWTVVPTIIVVLILIPTVRGIFATQPTPPKDALVVEVIGHQWWWEFRYPELGVVTANELVLPIDRNVDLQLHSADVVHSFWIPRVGGKRDVNPQPRTVPAERARISHIQFSIEKAGYYAGQCAEFCGDSHGLMRSAVVAMTQQEFGAWATSMGSGVPAADTVKGPALADQPKSPATAPVNPQPQPQVNEMSPTGAPAPGRGVLQSTGPVPPGTQTTALEEEGKKIFTSRACVACHTINGTSAQGKIGPNLTRFGMRRGVGALAVEATQENVERWIHRPKDIKPGALMPGAQEGAGGMPATGLNASEIKAIAAYLKSLK